MRVDASMANLTPRQERFAVAMVESGNGAEAARRAGYSAHSARAIASENLTKPDIVAEIDRRRAVIAQEHVVTIESLVDDLRAARDLAMQLDRPSAAIAAVMAMAKLCGLLDGPKQHPRDPYENMTDDELDAKSAELDARIEQFRG